MNARHNTSAVYRCASGLLWSRSSAAAIAVCVLLGRGQAAGAEFEVGLTPVASGLSASVDIANAGDSRLFVVDREGVIRIVQSDRTVLGTPFLDIRSKVQVLGESGLLGLAFHPSYSTNGFLYVDYVNLDGNIVIARYSVSGDPNLADPDSESIVLTVTHQPFPNHNGGDLNFGPDGYLYISVGDGAGFNSFNGQERLSLLGKILRIDVDGGPPYAIPVDNPFVADPNTLDEIWALGFRNPYRFSFDRLSGDMFIGDVGEDVREEVDFEPNGSAGGVNYGWRCYEGSLPFNLTGCGPIGDYTFPIHEYAHGPACAVIGGFVYRGSLYPTLNGHYLFTDFCTGDLWSLLPDGGGGWELNGFGPLVPPFGAGGFGEDADGEVYVGSMADETVYQVVTRLGCPAAPLGACRQPGPGQAQLLIRNDANAVEGRKLTWKWKKGDVTPLGAFGDPIAADYALCIYAGTTQALAVEASVPSGASCPACWSTTGKGFKYRDSGLAGEGIRKMVLKSGDLPGQAKVVVKGKGAWLPSLPAVPVTDPLRVQLINSDDECWEATYSAPATRNANNVFKDSSD
jgi:glucose/arabinose dehydrogenase